MVIGVAICDCGGKLGNIINYDAVSQAVQGLNVPVKKLNNLCLEAGIADLANFIKTNSVDKLVVGACTAKFIEYQLRKALPSIKEFEFVVLREHIAWPNKATPDKATKKASILLKAAIAALEIEDKIDQENYKVEQTAVVIGGGVAGIQAALDLAPDVKVILIEKDSELGGNLRNLGKVFPGELLIQEILKEKVAQLSSNPTVTIYTDSLMGIPAEILRQGLSLLQRGLRNLNRITWI
ncbi:MAG: NAD(P)-binding protein [Candidatus Helarchaeota archaeon]